MDSDEVAHFVNSNLQFFHFVLRPVAELLVGMRPIPLAAIRALGVGRLLPLIAVGRHVAIVVKLIVLVELG